MSNTSSGGEHRRITFTPMSLMTGISTSNYIIDFIINFFGHMRNNFFQIFMMLNLTNKIASRRTLGHWCQNTLKCPITSISVVHVRINWSWIAEFCLNWSTMKIVDISSRQCFFCRINRGLWRWWYTVHSKKRCNSRIFPKSNQKIWKWNLGTINTHYIKKV